MRKRLIAILAAVAVILSLLMLPAVAAVKRDQYNDAEPLLAKPRRLDIDTPMVIEGTVTASETYRSVDYILVDTDAGKLCLTYEATLSAPLPEKTNTPIRIYFTYGGINSLAECPGGFFVDWTELKADEDGVLPAETARIASSLIHAAPAAFSDGAVVARRQLLSDPKGSNQKGLNGGCTVYVSKSGVYHKQSNCSGMKQSTPMSLQEAINEGYLPCKNCAQ